MLSRFGKKSESGPGGDVESHSLLPNDEPDSTEELSEIEQARRDLMLARLESFKDAEEQPSAEFIEPEPVAPEPPADKEPAREAPTLITPADAPAVPEPPAAKEPVRETPPKTPPAAASAVSEPPVIEEAGDEAPPMTSPAAVAASNIFHVAEKPILGEDAPTLREAGAGGTAAALPDSARGGLSSPDSTPQEVPDEDSPEQLMETTAAEVEAPASSLTRPPALSAGGERIPDQAAGASVPAEKPYPLPRSFNLYKHYNRHSRTNDKIIDDIMYSIVNADIAFHRRNSSQEA
ncbi:MAG: hypothetical protein AMJ79_05750 [Phycisphaerae bacterium SM23_30]|nr:MAG: hypothetical protein AMJ79_05750 [Phycisphaerae bacterium SM23_30]